MGKVGSITKAGEKTWSARGILHRLVKFVT